jgi:hypothetical protein
VQAVPDPTPPFRRSDAWLLLSIIYAGKPADTKVIREVGDFINHAIFTDDELEGGLARLEAAGHIVAQNGRFAASPGVREWFQGVSPPRSQVHKDLERVSDFLSITA